MQFGDGVIWLSLFCSALQFFSRGFFLLPVSVVVGGFRRIEVLDVEGEVLHCLDAVRKLANEGSQISLNET